MVEVVREPGPIALERGATVGRYTILALLGSGGVGEVFAAYDPELDRKVALKLLRAHGDANDARAQARLLREAKAMARLSHPNVVAVHDVGAFGARVFVAMDFVDGLSLKDWLAAEARTRAEILGVFLAAARGLAAAHAAGLVHRDFKPGNVMVGRDGSVRVMDFGLARELSDTNAAPTALDDVGAVGAGNLHVTLTATGELMGTPLYMSPEQFRAAPTDARTDQFSFCVALYQALYGDAPFGDATLTAIMIEVLAGRVRDAPPKTSVPGWLRRVLLRGLSVEPDARWPSMDALATQLARDPARARRRAGLAVGALALVTLSSLTLVRAARRPALLCQGGPARLARLWEPATTAAHPRRDAVRAAFLASGAPAAGEVWDRVATLLDRYAARWLAMYRDACEATHVRGEQSAATLDLRMACLDERRTAVGALTDVLVTADRGVVGSAVNSVNALPGLERCADVQQLRTPIEPPRDEETRRRVEDVRARLSVVKALNDTGKHEEATKSCEALLKEARAIGYQPLLAEVLAAYVKGSGTINFHAAMLPLFEEGILTAIGAGRDDLAVENAVTVAELGRAYFNLVDESTFWLNLSRALSEQLGDSRDLMRSWIAHTEAVWKLADHDPRGALVDEQNAVALKEKALPANHPDIALSLNTEAEVLVALGRLKEALEINARAHEMLLQAYGPAATEVSMVLGNRGEYLTALGRPAEALAPFREALAGWEQQLGPDHPFVAYPLTGIGNAELALGRPKEAIAPLERALHVRESGASNEPRALADTRFALARALWDADAELARARRLATQARDAYALGKDTQQRADVDAWLSAHAPSR
ncbi:MAG TPA: serine/threonine-protein kinase [Polyangia bacterium]|nr:serine/threonine-protein kinase [Polyangia bacterium]